MPCKGCLRKLYAHWTYSSVTDKGKRTLTVNWFDACPLGPTLLPAPHFVLIGKEGATPFSTSRSLIKEDHPPLREYILILPEHGTKLFPIILSGRERFPMQQGLKYQCENVRQDIKLQ